VLAVKWAARQHLQRPDMLEAGACCPEARRAGGWALYGHVPRGQTCWRLGLVRSFAQRPDMLEAGGFCEWHLCHASAKGTQMHTDAITTWQQAQETQEANLATALPLYRNCIFWHLPLLSLGCVPHTQDAQQEAASKRQTTSIRASEDTINRARAWLVKALLPNSLACGPGAGCNNNAFLSGATLCTDRPRFARNYRRGDTKRSRE
jgi:hypothetical protein